MRYTRDRAELAVRHLRRADVILRDVIRQAGPFTLRPHRDRFGMLVRSIISQQISVLAARSIRRRVEALVLPERPTAQNLAALTREQLRSAGLSPQKLTYLTDLCAHVCDGRLNLRTIGRKPDEDVVAELIQVKGIGRWTAQMFLIFALGRLDVLPHDDLGVRSAIRRLYGLPELPDRATSERIAEPWRPYASVASWYCWRSLEFERSAATVQKGYPV
jgi:DNA-3-methyladenine glycosylase II